jgi:phospholipid-binding lipoprotein MlaA
MSLMKSRWSRWPAATPIAAVSTSLLGCSTMSRSVAFESDQPAEIDYDPWVRFNERTFWFNHDLLDRYALKPAATVWHEAVPDLVSQSLAHAFDNLDTPKRLVNNVLQGRLEGAGREIARFALNTTVGIAGLFDVATRVGVEQSDADTGQTLGTYGVGPGPYLVLPFLPPLTVRDGIGYAVDSMLDPVSYFAPFAANFGRSAAKTINERAANLELYQAVEDSSLDLYGAVRNGYLQRRRKSVEDAARDREREPANQRFFACTPQPSRLCRLDGYALVFRR